MARAAIPWWGAICLLGLLRGVSGSGDLLLGMPKKQMYDWAGMPLVEDVNYVPLMVRLQVKNYVNAHNVSLYFDFVDRHQPTNLDPFESQYPIYVVNKYEINGILEIEFEITFTGDLKFAFGAVEDLAFHKVKSDVVKFEMKLEERSAADDFFIPPSVLQDLYSGGPWNDPYHTHNTHLIDDFSDVTPDQYDSVLSQFMSNTQFIKAKINKPAASPKGFKIDNFKSVLRDALLPILHHVEKKHVIIENVGTDFVDFTVMADGPDTIRVSREMESYYFSCVVTNLFAAKGFPDVYPCDEGNGFMLSVAIVSDSMHAVAPAGSTILVSHKKMSLTLMASLSAGGFVLVICFAFVIVHVFKLKKRESKIRIANEQNFQKAVQLDHQAYAVEQTKVAVQQQAWSNAQTAHQNMYYAEGLRNKELELLQQENVLNEKIAILESQETDLKTQKHKIEEEKGAVETETARLQVAMDELTARESQDTHQVDKLKSELSHMNNRMQNIHFQIAAVSSEYEETSRNLSQALETRKSAAAYKLEKQIEERKKQRQLENETETEHEIENGNENENENENETA